MNQESRTKNQDLMESSLKRILIVMLLISPFLGIKGAAQLLYEVSGNGVQDKSYILATNKLCNITFLDTIPNLFKIFGECDKLITDMAITDEQALQALREAALLPDSVQLKNFYTPEEYNAIDQALFLTLQMGLDHLGRMKPAYLTEMYRNELLKRWLNYDENTSSEIFFQSVANQQGMPIYALDEIGEALYMMFDREPMHWQTQELLNITKHPERETQLEKAILAQYKIGQLNEIAYLITTPNNLATLSYSDYQIFATRNRTWVKRLEPYLQEGNAFICLNANYLGGEKGLLSCLKAAGYRIRPANRGK